MAPASGLSTRLGRPVRLRLKGHTDGVCYTAGMAEEMSPRFYALVLAWLKERDPLAVEVVAVVSDSSDWDGDTEGGFYSTFAVEVRYLDADGRKTYVHLQGEEMESLWLWVVRAV